LEEQEGTVERVRSRNPDSPPIRRKESNFQVPGTVERVIQKSGLAT
jgi:hypothetical protein